MSDENEEREEKSTKHGWVSVVNTGIIAVAVSVTGHYVTYAIQSKEVEINEADKTFQRDMARMQFNYGLLKDYLALLPDGTQRERMMFDYMVMAFSGDLDAFAKTLKETEASLVKVDLKLESARKLEAATQDAQARGELARQIEELERKKRGLEQAATSYRERPFSAEVDSKEFMAGVTAVPSARRSVVEREPGLATGMLALVGLRVGHGDIIDAITPVFAEISPQLAIVRTLSGDRIGGEGGGETLLRREGYLVTAIELQRGAYFGRDEVIHLRVTWQRLTPNGLDPASEVTSETLGSGNFATPKGEPRRLAAEPGNYIADLAARVSDHTSGETFLNDLYIRQEPLALKGG